MTIPINDSHAIPPGDEAAAALARLGDAYAEPATAKSCPSCPHCGKTFHVEDAPAKTHDLSIYRVHGNVVARAEGEETVHLVYLPAGVAQDLGRVLDALTPAQRQLLIDDLTGGGK